MNRAPTTRLICLLAILVSPMFAFASNETTTHSMAASQGKACVIAPKITSSYKYVFDEMKEGIMSTLPNAHIFEYDPKNPKAGSQMLADLIACRSHPTIVLSKKALSYAKQAGLHRVILGAVKSNQSLKQSPTLSLPYTINPELFLSTLQKIAPKIESIHIIGSASKLKAFTDPTFTQHASNLKLSIIPHTVKSSKERAKAYQRTVKSIDPQREAIWVQDQGKQFMPVLQWLLKESWDRKIILLSNNLGDVKRGALFTLYPDNHRYGQSLAEVAVQLSMITASAGSQTSDMSIEANQEQSEEGLKTLQRYRFIKETKLAINKIALRNIIGPDFPIRSLSPDLILPFSQ